MPNMWGWKTILAAVFWAAANALKDGPSPWNVVGQILEFIYPILFGVGVTHKIAKAVSYLSKIKGGTR